MTLGEQREQHLGLVRALLYVAQDRRAGWPAWTSACPKAFSAWLLPTPGRPNASTFVAVSRNAPVASVSSLLHDRPPA